MFSLFSKWIGEQPAKTDELSPPTLPQSRPRSLTPSPSQESLFKSAASATENSAFFQKLPFEIRHKILRDAFGNRTIHIDLYYDYPMKPLHERQRNQTQRDDSTRVPPPKSQWGTERKQKKKWQWLSGECYRSTQNMPSNLEEFEYFEKSYPGMTDCCEIFHTSLGIRSVGVMGWLLSCRQAYAECIDVLYATNTMYMTGNPLFQQLQDVQFGPGTIHMAGDVLPRLLPNVLLPKRLANITSARVRWTSHPFGYESETSPFYKRLDLSNFLKDLPRIFPHLKRLHLSLEGKMKPIPYVEHDPLLEAVESVILAPVDDMVRSLGPQMEKCHLAIAAYLFVTMKYKPTNSPRNLSSQERYDRFRPWRELPPSGSTAAHAKGYEIRIGQLDIPIKAFIPEGYDDF